MTLKQTHRFKATESTVKRSVRCEESRIALVTEAPGDFIAMEFGRSLSKQVRGAQADGCF
jgi:hypothetical protein